MKKLRLILGLLTVGMITWSLHSCRDEERNNEREQAVTLYQRTCRAASIYTDSLSKAKDSTEVTDLFNRFEERLVEINYSVLPDTDYGLSEGENDTIKMMLDTLLAVHDLRLRQLGEKKQEPIDSIDSLVSGQNVHLTSAAVKIKHE